PNRFIRFGDIQMGPIIPRRKQAKHRTIPSAYLDFPNCFFPCPSGCTYTRVDLIGKATVKFLRIESYPVCLGHACIALSSPSAIWFGVKPIPFFTTKVLSGGKADRRHFQPEAFATVF